MREAEAIEILKNRREYYNMHHTGYDNVIRYLEGRERRKKDKGDLEERERLIVNEFNDLIDSLDTLRIDYFNRCTFFLESIAELEEQIHAYKEKWN